MKVWTKDDGDYGETHTVIIKVFGDEALANKYADEHSYDVEEWEVENGQA